MGIYKEGQHWRADVYVSGKRVKVKKRFLTKKEAKLWHDTTVINYVPETTYIEPEKRIIFNEVIQLFEEFHLPKIAMSTRRRYVQDIELRIRPLLSHIEVKDFNPIFLESFSKKIFDILSVKTANNCIGLLKTICNQAVRWEMMDPSLIKHIQMRKIHRSPYTWWQNKEDVLRFLATAQSDPYYLAYRLGLECGMRLSEIVGLCKDAIDLQNYQINVHRQWVEKDRTYTPPKHGKNRFIRFEKDSEIHRLLEQAVSANPAEPRLFLSYKGKVLSGKKLSSIYFQRLIRKSGVPRIRFHDLRHTFASWYMMVSNNIWELKGILGHADIQTTQKYAHLSHNRQGIPQIFKREE